MDIPVYALMRAAEQRRQTPQMPQVWPWMVAWSIVSILTYMIIEEIIR